MHIWLNLGICTEWLEVVDQPSVTYDFFQNFKQLEAVIDSDSELSRKINAKVSRYLKVELHLDRIDAYSQMLHRRVFLNGFVYSPVQTTITAIDSSVGPIPRVKIHVTFKLRSAYNFHRRVPLSERQAFLRSFYKGLAIKWAFRSAKKFEKYDLTCTQSAPSRASGYVRLDTNAYFHVCHDEPFEWRSARSDAPGSSIFRPFYIGDET